MNVDAMMMKMRKNPSPPTPLPEDGARGVEVLFSSLAEAARGELKFVANEIFKFGLCFKTLFMLLALGTTVGCNRKIEVPQEVLIQVTGQLVIDGQGIEGVSLKLLPARADMRQMREPGAVTEKDGRFTMSYKSVYDGVPPGEYLLLAFWLEQPEGGGMMRDRFQGKYMDFNEPIRKIVVADQVVDLGRIEIETEK